MTTTPPPVAIKMRVRGKRAWYFVRSTGTGTRLTIHAAQLASEADASAKIERWSADNPELEFKVAYPWGKP